MNPIILYNFSIPWKSARIYFAQIYKVIAIGFEKQTDLLHAVIYTR